MFLSYFVIKTNICSSFDESWKTVHKVIEDGNLISKKIWPKCAVFDLYFICTCNVAENENELHRLITSGVNINATGENGNAALLVAAERGNNLDIK